MRLIDADKFILALMDASLSSVDEDTILDLVDSVPTVDAEPVVRCRDCKYWGDEHGTAQRADGALYARCRLHNHDIGDRHIGWVPTENDFCSCGERRNYD